MDINFLEFCGYVKTNVIAVIKETGDVQPAVLCIYKRKNQKVPQVQTLIMGEESEHSIQIIRQHIKKTKPVGVVGIHSLWIIIKASTEPPMSRDTSMTEILRDGIECVLIEGADEDKNRYAFCQPIQRLDNRIILPEPIDLSTGICQSDLLDGLFDTIH